MGMFSTRNRPQIRTVPAGKTVGGGVGIRRGRPRSSQALVRTKSVNRAFGGAGTAPGSGVSRVGGYGSVGEGRETAARWATGRVSAGM
jgi:hypothetical protein